MICPRCGAIQQDNSIQCTACGLSFRQPNNYSNQPNSRGGQPKYNRVDQPDYNQSGGRGGQQNYNQSGGRGGQQNYNQSGGRGGQPGYNQPNSRGGQPGYNQPNSRGGQPNYNQPNSRGGRPNYNQPNSRGGQPNYNRNNPSGGRRPNQQSSSKTPIIIGILIGALFLVCAVILFVVLMQKKPEDSKTTASGQKEESTAESSTTDKDSMLADSGQKEPERKTEEKTEEKTEKKTEEKTEEKTEAKTEAKTEKKTEAPTEQATSEEKAKEEKKSYYILPMSSEKLLYESDLSSLSNHDLMIARNEIYARHGYIFNDAELSDYFNAQGWYSPRIKSDDFSEDMLSEIEKKNIQTIKALESGTPINTDTGYIFSNSSEVYLTDADVKGLSNYDLMIARNEIYARHGYIFNDAELAQYFSSKSWYSPRIKSDDFSEDMLNEVEKKNIQLIGSYEK